MQKHIPNAITLFNLFFGCCALVWAFEGRPDLSMLFLLGSFACDTADGLVARALGVSSELGTQLDSLSDVVSFGVVPGALLYGLMRNACCQDASGICIAALPAFLISMAAAYRLGKFNIDTRQTHYFLGLNTPLTTVLVLGLVLGAYHNRFGFGDWFLQNSWLLYPFVLLLAILMVSDVPLAGLKIKKFKWQGNEALFTLVGVFLILLYFVKELAFALIILIYIGYSLSIRKSILGQA
jgi:CDP-diacylglycerol--serine O-phosphatidyltransferase